MSPMCADSQARAPFGEAEGVLQVAADGEGGAHRQRQGERQRGVAARAADEQRFPVADAHHGVVARHLDRPVVA